MKKFAISCLSALLLSQLLLIGCADSASDQSAHVTALEGGLRLYPAQISCPDCTDIPESRIYTPALILDENDSTFELFCGALSSHIYWGTYKIVDGYLIAVGYGDSPGMLNFTANDDGTFTFIAEGSENVIVYPGMHGISLADGTVFG